VAFGGDEVEVATAKLRGVLLLDADKSDPLNQFVVAGLMVNERLAIRARADQQDGPGAHDRAIAALAAAVIEHHAEIRDALAED
jgi:hypothetical protein